MESNFANVNKDPGNLQRGRSHPTNNIHESNGVSNSSRATRAHQVPSPPRVRHHSVSHHENRQSHDMSTYMQQVPSPPHSLHGLGPLSHPRDEIPESQPASRESSTYRRRSRSRENRLSSKGIQATGPSASIPTLLLPEDRREKYVPLVRSASHTKPKIRVVDAVPFGSTTSIGGLLGEKGYRYKPLAKGQFRVLVLWPSRSAAIRCQIMHCTLDDPEFAYIAISYAWGDIGDKRSIRIRDADRDEEVEINITASLEAALRAVRKRDDRVYVWADALSIDQQNWVEKKEQVRKMTQIYQKAKRVAIWLGPEADDSELALALIQKVGTGTKLPSHIDKQTASPFTKAHLAATAALFDRDYWYRLWVVQEVFNAREIAVYCGRSVLPWSCFKETSEVLRNSKTILYRNFPIGTRSEHYYFKNSNLSVPQALRYQGPTSFLELGSPSELHDLEKKKDEVVFKRLLEVMKMCRRKLSSDPKDKVFGVLGVLPTTIREEIQIDYGCSVKDVYINIVDILLRTTGSLDIICEAIHFPPHANNVSIPSWVPDWSHVPDSKSIGEECRFSASGTTRHKARIDPYMKSKLEITAIHLGTVKDQGVALGTLCTLPDYLMAFLQWRSLLLDSFAGADEASLLRAQQEFCLTLCLHQVPSAITSASSWMDLCYHVFASSIKERMPSLAIDEELKNYTRMDFDMSLDDRRQFIQDHIASRMMGRRFLMTKEKLMGLGTGFLMRGDIVVVALGCSTPIVLRPEGKEYRFVGDVYISGYMRGKAVQENEDSVEGRGQSTYVLH